MGSEGLRELMKREGTEREDDVMGARIRYGYTYGEEGGKKTIGLEDEIVGVGSKTGELAHLPIVPRVRDFRTPQHDYTIRQRYEFITYAT